MERIVVSGAGRGLGLEFCRQYLENGDGVVALAKNPSSSLGLYQLKNSYPNLLEIVGLDVANYADVAAFGTRISSLPVNILINNAGVIGPETHKGEAGQSVDTLDPQIIESMFRINAVGALMLTKALLPSLILANNPRVVVLGSTVALPRESFGDYYGYRMSKAAAHIAFATLAVDLDKLGIAAGVVCPGWVQTDLGGSAAPLLPRDSVSGMRRVIEKLCKNVRDRMFVWDESEIPL